MQGEPQATEPDELAVVRRHALFEDLEAHDLEALLATAEIRSAEAGALILAEGDEGSDMFFILEGEVEITRGEGAQKRLLVVRGAGEVFGEMAPLGGARRNASVRAITAVRLLVVGQDALQKLLATSASASLTMVRTVTQRLRSAEAMLVQQEKLAGLGTLAAGLAHELNNPAAAIVRASAQLHQAQLAAADAFTELAATGLPEAERAPLAGLLDEARGGGGTAQLAALDAMDVEEELGDALVASGVGGGRELAAVLAEAGWRADELAQRLAPFAPERRAAVVRCAAAAGEVAQLLRETGIAADAISEIVASVKSYSYLDQAPVQAIDVHAGLESTLVMLRHKLKDGIELERDFADGVPRIAAHGSELNQVWTNLIDNAIDAMGGRGRLRIATAVEGTWVTVSVCDGGPGIPAELQARVFDPFFTTKAVGSGTGLGLHVVYSIVKRHHGRVRLSSDAGGTCFYVELPVAGA